jgi:hypothetical protein
MSEMIAWAKANPELAVAIVAYLIANFWPRPDASKLTGASKAFWQILDRLCFLTATKVPGRLKLPLLDSPEQSSDDGSEEEDEEPLVVTHGDGDEDSDEDEDDDDEGEEEDEESEDDK